MNYTIKSPDSLKASIQLPASKSICNRALILNALSYSPYEIRNLSDCDDTEVMVKALNSNDRDFDIKAAGTAMRFLTAFLSKVVGEWTITGTERMKNRPIKILVDALNALGARVEYMEKEGYPPLRIFGSALQGGEISLAGGVSSQYISALLMIAEIELLGLFKNSLQGDAAGAKLFAQLGVGTTYTDRGVVLKHNGNRTQKLNYNFVNEPDLAQTFVVTCVLLNIPFRFTGLQSLKIKETDRIEALKTELRKLGYLLTDSNNSILEWNGERCEPQAHPVIATYEDHRMAMAFAPVALVLPEGIEIADPQVVSKSYPHYWRDLRTAGFIIIDNEQLAIDN